MSPRRRALPGSAARPARDHGRRQRLLGAAALAVALGVPVAVLALLVRARVPAILTFDEGAVRAATAITRSEPALLTALLVWQEVSRPVWVNLAIVLVCRRAWRRHGLQTRARWAVVTVLAAWGVQAGVKLVVQRTRPVVEDAVAHAPGYSFPSGHAANTASAGAVLVLLLWPLLRRRGRVVATSLAAAAVVLTCLDRVFLGVHHPSDVVAGVLLGAAVAGASFAGASFAGASLTGQAGATPPRTAGTSSSPSVPHRGPDGGSPRPARPGTPAGRRPRGAG